MQLCRWFRCSIDYVPNRILEFVPQYENSRTHWALEKEYALYLQQLQSDVPVDQAQVCVMCAQTFRQRGDHDILCSECQSVYRQSDDHGIMGITGVGATIPTIATNPPFQPSAVPLTMASPVAHVRKRGRDDETSLADNRPTTAPPETDPCPNMEQDPPPESLGTTRASVRQQRVVQLYRWCYKYVNTSMHLVTMKLSSRVLGKMRARILRTIVTLANVNSVMLYTVKAFIVGMNMDANEKLPLCQLAKPLCDLLEQLDPSLSACVSILYVLLRLQGNRCWSSVILAATKEAQFPHFFYFIVNHTSLVQTKGNSIRLSSNSSNSSSSSSSSSGA